MPALAAPTNRGISPAPFQPINPASYFDRTPTTDTTALSAATGKSALYGGIAKLLSDLPQKLTEAYQQGQKMRTSGLVRGEYESALSGQPTASGAALSDFKATSAGDITLQTPTALDKAKALKYITPTAAKPAKKTLWEQVLERNGVNPSEIRTPVAAPDAAGSSSAVEPELPTQDEPADFHDFGLLNQPEADAVPAGATPSLPAADPTAAAAPSPIPGLDDATAKIDAASKQVAGQLSSIPPSELSVSNPGGAPVPAASLFPAESEPPQPAAKPLAGVRQSTAATTNPTTAPTQGSTTVDRMSGIVTTTAPDGRKFQLLPLSNTWKEVKTDKAPPVPATIRTEAARMGVWKEGMTAEDASKAMETKQIDEGVIPPHLLPTAQSMARLVIGHPSLKHYPTIREAKEAIDAGLANPEAGGFSDMALVEGFQRMINPGATVRAQTIQNMIDAAGWMQKLDPKFAWQKAVQGDKFSDAARKRIKELSEDIYQRSTKNVKPQLDALGKVAKSYGIANPEAFVNNVLVMTPLFDASGTEVPADAPAPGAAATTQATTQPSGQDQEAVAWLKSNPNDPRAAKVRAALKAKGIAVQ